MPTSSASSAIVHGWATRLCSKPRLFPTMGSRTPVSHPVCCSGMRATFVLTLRKNVVFATGGLTALAGGAGENQPVHVRATGRFVLDAKTNRTFNNMPAVLTISEGLPLLLSNID